MRAVGSANDRSAAACHSLVDVGAMKGDEVTGNFPEAGGDTEIAGMGTADRGQRGKEEALILRAQDGDTDAFAALVSGDAEALRRFCARLMGAEDADDLAQETLIRAWRSIGRLGAPYRFRAWLFGIAANVARKWWHRRRLAVSLERLFAEAADVGADEASDPWAAAAGPETVVEGGEERRRLQEALDALPTALRRVVVLHYLEGLSYTEVAAALAVPLSTVKGRLFKSRRRLRGELGAFFGSVDGKPRRDPEALGTATQIGGIAIEMDEPIRMVVDRGTATSAAPSSREVVCFFDTAIPHATNWCVAGTAAGQRC